MNRRIALSVAFIGVNLMACCCGGFGQQAKPNEAVIAEQKKPKGLSPRVAEILGPDQTANVDAVKIKLIAGTIGKLALGNPAKPTRSKETYFQIRVQVLNEKPNLALEFSGKWDSLDNHGLRPSRLIDEFDNEYLRSTRYFRPELAEFSNAKDRIDTGQALEDLLVFEMPIATAKELYLELGCGAVQKPGTILAWKLPRSFFMEK